MVLSISDRIFKQIPKCASTEAFSLGETSLNILPLVHQAQTNHFSFSRRHRPVSQIWIFHSNKGTTDVCTFPLCLIWSGVLPLKIWPTSLVLSSPTWWSQFGFWLGFVVVVVLVCFVCFYNLLVKCYWKMLDPVAAQHNEQQINKSWLQILFF